MIIGIDPGKNGGIAVIDQDRKAKAWKMPDTPSEIYESIVDAVCHGANIAFIEQVHSSPQMGVKSAFSFGNSFGHLEMAMTALAIPFHRIRPQAWQKELGCLSGGDKNVTKRRAQELFPYLKITHATADALLIAEYGRRQK